MRHHAPARARRSPSRACVRFRRLRLDPTSPRSRSVFAPHQSGNPRRRVHGVDQQRGAAPREPVIGASLCCGRPHPASRPAEGLIVEGRQRRLPNVSSRRQQRGPPLRARLRLVAASSGAAIGTEGGTRGRSYCMGVRGKVPGRRACGEGACLCIPTRASGGTVSRRAAVPKASAKVAVKDPDGSDIPRQSTMRCRRAAGRANGTPCWRRRQREACPGPSEGSRLISCLEVAGAAVASDRYAASASRRTVRQSATAEVFCAWRQGGFLPRRGSAEAFRRQAVDRGLLNVNPFRASGTSRVRRRWVSYRRRRARRSNRGAVRKPFQRCVDGRSSPAQSVCRSSCVQPAQR